MQLTYFATETAEASGLGALGVSPKAFLIQLLTFIFVFLLLLVSFDI